MSFLKPIGGRARCRSITMISRASLVAAAVGLLGGGAGCQTSSHKSVSMYEYDEDPARTHRAAQPVEREESGQWDMQSPGQMVSPGEAVFEPK